MAAGSSKHFEIFLDKLARKSLYCGFSSGGGGGGCWHCYCHFPSDSVRSLLDFGMKKFVDFLGTFLCDVMSNPLQNHECNISPHTVSDVHKFDEIKGSN